MTAPRDTITPDNPTGTDGTRTTGVTTGRVLRAELIKLRSVRSTFYALLVAVLSLVGMGAVMAVGVVVALKGPAGGPADAPVGDPTGGALSGVSLAVFAVATLGVLAVTGEYASGTIRATLAAVPRRSSVVVGKALALVALVLPGTLAGTLIAFVAAKAVLATADRSISLAEPGVLRAVVGAALYLTVVALLGAGFAWLLRSTAGALAALFGVLILLPAVAQLLPRGVAGAVVPYLPDNAGTAIMQLTPGDHLAPWTGFAVFCAYAVVTLTAAARLLHRRDA